MTEYADDPKDVTGIAKLKHCSPHKLADYNSVSYTATFDVGESIIVPYDECTPQPGQWFCYTVKAGDYLWGIANESPDTVVRDMQLLIDSNVDILWGETQIYEG